MSHLPTDRLAALADDVPTALEAEHLASCLECTRERAAHAALVTLAGDERARIAPPLTRWEVIAERLREEKIITASPAGGSSRRVLRWAPAVAAALLLFAGGVTAGRAWERTAARDGVPGSEAGSDTAQAPFASVAEAEAALGRAEASYQRALQYLAEMDASGLPQRDDALRGRLAALDEVASISARALNETPYDPVLNSYYLSTLGAREATLRQLDAALPEGARLTSY